MALGGVSDIYVLHLARAHLIASGAGPLFFPFSHPMSVSPNVSRDSDPENFFAELASLKKFPHKKFGNSCSTCLKEEKDIGRLMRRCSKVRCDCSSGATVKQ
jgi:hypothetical protein